MPFASEVLSYLQDIFYLTSSQNFDEAIFQSYHVIGRSLCTRGVAGRSNQSLSAILASTLGQKLDAFNSSWQLYSGLRMEQLWMRFRPATASHILQLELSAQIKDLADQFDSLKWRSGASVQELDILRGSLARIHTTLATPSAQTFGPLEVRKCLPASRLDLLTIERKYGATSMRSRAVQITIRLPFLLTFNLNLRCFVSTARATKVVFIPKRCP